ncbi:MAG: hypothetical protein LC731_00860 [Acidobacteria bacterium]|nr:hypothetical protein [Acidobacteriota bacterium]
MSLFNCLKWPEMREVAVALIKRMHAGHKTGAMFYIPVVDSSRPARPPQSWRKWPRAAT